MISTLIFLMGEEILVLIDRVDSSGLQGLSP